MEIILICRLCERKIKTDDDTDYEAFTEHLTEFHFPELVEAYANEAVLVT